MLRLAPNHDVKRHPELIVGRCECTRHVDSGIPRIVLVETVVNG